MPDPSLSAGGARRREPLAGGTDRAHPPALACWGRRRRPRCPPASAGRRPGRTRSAIPPAWPGLRSGASRPVAGHRHGAAAGPADGPIPQLCRARLHHHRAAGPLRLSGHPIQRRFGHRLCPGSAGLPAGQGADRAAGLHPGGRYHHLPQRRAVCWMPSGEPKLFDRGQVLVGQGIRYDTCIRRGVITDALTNFTEGSTRLVPARQRLAGLQLQPDLCGVERDHQLRPAGAPLSLFRRGR